MTGALIILAVTVVTGLVLYLTRDKSTVSEHSVPTADGQDDTTADEECCGRHAVCEKGLLPREELYFNDEELDRYVGREPESYTESEIEEFREVLYTLSPAEVYAWGVALTQRDIPLPLPLRDEWIMMTER